jgi:hypothetical protein
MLATVASLIILLGLMVSLARYVRGQSAETLTRELLDKLERMMSQKDNVANTALQTALAQVPPLLKSRSDDLDEAALLAAARANSRSFVRAWQENVGPRVFRDLPFSLYDDTMLRDAWGTPVVFMPPGAQNLGIDPQFRPFFFSAGPDRRFKTVLDNLYSYERAWDQ